MLFHYSGATREGSEEAQTEASGKCIAGTRKPARSPEPSRRPHRPPRRAQDGRLPTADDGAPDCARLSTLPTGRRATAGKSDPRQAARPRRAQVSRAGESGDGEVRLPRARAALHPARPARSTPGESPGDHCKIAFLDRQLDQVHPRVPHAAEVETRYMLALISSRLFKIVISLFFNNFL